MNPIDDYIDELEVLGRTYGTIKQTKQILKKFQNSCNGKGILQVDDDTIKTFIKSMRDEKIEERTISDYVKTVKRFYSYLVESQKYGIAFNPATRLSSRLKTKRRQTRRPNKSIEELSRMIKSIHSPRDRAINVLFAKTAIRNGELVALDVDDIDFSNETVMINKHVGNESINEIVPHRKNGNDTLIPLDDEGIRTLKFYLMTRQKTEDKALFISNTGKRLYPTDISRIVKEWSIKTGLAIDTNETDKKIVPHFWRAWTTYILQVNGCNPAVIDAIRGDTAGTIRAYYVNQVIPFEFIRREYLRTVPKFGV